MDVDRNGSEHERLPERYAEKVMDKCFSCLFLYGV